MASTFFHQLYDKAWKDKQLAKYRDLLPVLKEFLPPEPTVLDFGIGPGWLWPFLKENGLPVKKVYGIDESEERVEPKQKDIAYYFSVEDFMKANPKVELDGLFFVDSLQFLEFEDARQLKGLLKRGGVVVISLPRSQAGLLHNFDFGPIEWEGEVGEQEKDWAWVMRIL